MADIDESSKWAVVVVHQPATKTKRLIVNVYGYPTKRAAEKHKRETLRDKDYTGITLAVRVRPIISDAYIEELKAKLNAKDAINNG